MDRKGGKVPVFVFPTTLVFYLGARETHKQLLTIYNPYDFGVRFQGMTFDILINFKVNDTVFLFQYYVQPLINM